MLIKKLYSFCLFLLLLNINLLAQQPRLVLPTGHTFHVWHATFSPDNSKVATAGFDNVTRIWDARTGFLLTELIGHSEWIQFSSFNPQGNKVVTASNDHTAKVWDVNTGKLYLTLLGHNGTVKTALFSPDGRKIVTTSTDYTAKLWDASTGGLLFNLVGHTDVVNNAVFSHDGQKLVTAASDNTALIWEISTGEKLISLESHTSTINSASFSKDDKHIITASWDNTVKLWDASDGKLLRNFYGHTGVVNAAEFSTDEKNIITASRDSSAKIWNVETGKMLLTLKGHTDKIEKACFSPDGKIAVTASWDNTAKIWNAVTGQLITTLKLHSDALNSLEFSSNGKKIVIASTDNTASIWSIPSGTLLTRLEGQTSGIESAVFSPDSKRFVAGYREHTAGIWDMSTGGLLKKLTGHKDWVTFAGFSKDGNKIITTSSDGNPKIWNAGTGELLLNLKESTEGPTIIYTASFSGDGKKLVTGHGDATARIWDVVTGKLLLILRGHTDNVYSTEFSPDNKKILTACWDGSARVWDASSGKVLQILLGHNRIVYDAKFSPDGKKILTCSDDSTAKIWDVQTGQLNATLKGNKGSAYKCFFTPSGDKLFIASSDGNLRTWNAKTIELENEVGLEGENSVMDISFATKRIVAASNGILALIDMKSGKIIYRNISLRGNEYINYTPSGYYQCSSNAAKLLHYVTKDLKVITFEQLDVKYNRPDKVLEAIGNKDTALIKSYRKAWEKRIKKLGIDTTSFRDGYSVPEAYFVNRDNIEYEQKNAILTLYIKGLDSTYKLDRFNVWVNEAPVYGQRGISIRKRNKNDFDTTITIKLSLGENRIETSITNVNGTESYRMPLTVNYFPAVKQKEMIRFIGIGIDQFADNQYNLQYSAKDIRDLVAKLKEKYGNDIIMDTLFNENVTVSNVKAIKQKLQQTTENDKVIIAYSGHGMLSKEYDYYLSTYSVNFDKPEQNGLPYDELENLLDSIPARKKLMLIDACHSGEVDKDDLVTLNASSDSLIKGLKPVAYKKEGHLGLRNSFELMQSLFVNVGKSTGATIISAAAGTQFALERNDLKNGVFTYSILEAMNKYPTLKTSELKKIVGERVEQLTNGLQKPTSRNETIVVDWALW